MLDSQSRCHLNEQPPSINNFVLSLLILSPEAFLNSSNIPVIQQETPLNRRKRLGHHQRKLRWVMKGESQDGWGLKTWLCALLSNIFDRTSIAIKNSRKDIGSLCLSLSSLQIAPALSSLQIAHSSHHWLSPSTSELKCTPWFNQWTYLAYQRTWADLRKNPNTLWVFSLLIFLFISLSSKIYMVVIDLVHWTFNF